MNNYLAACFDVYYYKNYAKACCIVFETGPPEKNISEYCKKALPTKPYVPGEFYKRELPCILAVYEIIQQEIDLIIIDGFVTLENGRKGLGVYLFEALNGKTPIIGVAKSPFKSIGRLAEVYRGKSNKPLYINTMGIDLNYASGLIRNLAGENRIPNVLKRVDHLTRIPVDT